MDFLKFPLIVTDGFDFYEKVVRRVFGPAALYGQVLKTRRNNRMGVDLIFTIVSITYRHTIAGM